MNHVASDGSLWSCLADKHCSRIHSDIKGDNVYMEPLTDSAASDHEKAGFVDGNNRNGEIVSWKPSHILDFSNLTFGDPVLNLIPLHLDILRGDSILLKYLLESYKLPLLKNDIKGEPILPYNVNMVKITERVVNTYYARIYFTKSQY